MISHWGKKAKYLPPTSLTERTHFGNASDCLQVRHFHNLFSNSYQNSLNFTRNNSYCWDDCKTYLAKFLNWLELFLVSTAKFMFYVFTFSHTLYSIEKATRAVRKIIQGDCKETSYFRRGEECVRPKWRSKT